jgi:hypothetical protein
VPQEFGRQILLAPVRVDDLAVLVHCHSVDREVAALEIFFQCDRGVGMHHKPAVARPRFALSARQREFLFGVGVQKYRKVSADLL